VELIGFDPVSSYMGGNVDTHRNTAVRNVLDPITQAAEDIGCAILSITHFNKGTGNKAIHRVMESAAFVNAPRASFGVFEDPEQQGTFLVLLLKTNMERPDGLRYSVDTKDIGMTDAKTGKAIVAPFIRWDMSQPVTITADEVVQSQSQEQSSPALNKAVVFLQEQLESGPKPVADVKAQADAQGISPHTLRRARESLGMRAETLPGVMPAQWVYIMPEQEVEAFTDADTADWDDLGIVDDNN
jgi:hypothetical protein